MEFLILVAIITVLLALVGSMNTIDVKKEVCKLHKWQYLPDGHMKCDKCQFITGS